MKQSKSDNFQLKNYYLSARFKNKENIIITNIPFCIQEFQNEFDSLWEEFEVVV